MPRILNGYWAAGIGGGIASVGRVGRLAPVAQWENAGGTCFLRPGVAIFQHGAHLESFDLTNGEYNALFDVEGADDIAAGGGVYAAKVGGVVRVKYLDGELAHYPLFGIGDVAPDASVLLRTPDGLLNGVLYVDGSVQALGGGAFLALDGNYRPVAVNATAPVALPGRIFGLRVHGDLCCYHTEEGGRLILQYRDRIVGYEVARGLRDCFRPDFERQADGSIFVLYAMRQGETPMELVSFIIPAGSLTQRLQPDPAPIPVPVPIPVPQPQPEPEPVSIPNIKDRLDAERAKYTTPLSGDDCVALLNAAAYGTGFKLYRKAGGRGKQPRTGIPCSTDILGYPDPAVGMRYADVLGSTGAGIASVNWPTGAWDASRPEDVGNYIDPVAPEGVPSQPPPQEPSPVVQPPAPSVDLSAVLAELKSLRELLDTHVEDTVDALTQIDNRLDKLFMRPAPAPSVKFPDYEGSIPYLGRVTLKPKP